VINREDVNEKIAVFKIGGNCVPVKSYPCHLVPQSTRTQYQLVTKNELAA